MPDPDAYIGHDPRGQHECPAPGCRLMVGNEFAFCRHHWYAVPKPLRDAVWKSYREGNAGTVGHIQLIQAAAAAIGPN